MKAVRFLAVALVPDKASDIAAARISPEMTICFLFPIVT